MALPDETILDLVKKSAVLNDTALKKAEDYAVKTRSPSLITAFIESGVLTEEQLGSIIASYYKVPYISLSKVTIPENVIHIIPEKVARRHKAFAFARDSQGIKVAMADPTNKTLLAFVARKTGERAMTYYADPKEIEGTIQLYKKGLQKTIDELLKEQVRLATTIRGSEIPIIKIVDELVNAAYQEGKLPTGIPVEDPATPASEAKEISKAGADICLLVSPTYVASLPTDPSLDVPAVSDCGSAYSTGYTVVKDAVGRVTVAAPDAELDTSIAVTR